MLITRPGERPVFLVSPPPEHWDAGGGDDGNVRAANAKMRGDINPRRALLAWIKFIDFVVYVFNAIVIVMPPPPRGSVLFDTVFVRDHFIWVPGVGIVKARMKAWDRDGEPDFTAQFLRSIGVEIADAMNHGFEGDSCAFLLPGGTAVVFGYGSRADREAGRQLAKLYKKPVISLQLDPDCFHLDLAGAALTSRAPTVLFHRGSLAKRCRGWRPDDGWRMLEEACRRDRSTLIELSHEDAARAVANSRDINGNLLGPPDVSPELQEQLMELGYFFYPMELDELLENGGGFTGCISHALPLEAFTRGIPMEFTWEVWKHIAMAMLSSYPKKVIRKPQARYIGPK